MRNARAYVRTGLMIATLTLGAVGQASAQPAVDPAAPPPPKPPRATRADDPNLFTNVFGLIVIGVLIVGASLIPSRRGHQD